MLGRKPHKGIQFGGHGGPMGPSLSGEALRPGLNTLPLVVRVLPVSPRLFALLPL